MTVQINTYFIENLGNNRQFRNKTEGDDVFFNFLAFVVGRKKLHFSYLFSFFSFFVMSTVAVAKDIPKETLWHILLRFPLFLHPGFTFPKYPTHPPPPSP